MQVLLVSQEGLETAYVSWKRHHRSFANHYVRTPVGFKLGFRPQTHPFTIFRTQRFGPSRKTFCKILALPPQVVERFECGTAPAVPDLIVEALSDAGMRPAEISALGSRVFAYSLYHREGRPIPGGLAR